MTRARNISRILSAQEVSGDFNLSGIVTATEFYGDGSNLTGVGLTADTSTNSLVVTGISTLGNVTAGVATANQFSGNITGTAATFSGNVTVGGVLTYDDVTNVDSLGIITARSGVSIADSIFHTGDTNTAIRFPAADTFTVETGGSEALRVDSSQRLLSGTTTEGAVNADDLTIATSGDTGITIRSADDGYGNLFFSDGTSGAAEYAGYVQYNHNDNSLVLGANSSTRLSITSAGNVSISNDSGKFTAGAGDDLLLYHDGSQSYIAGDDIRITNKAVGETMAKFLANGAVELNHDDSKKFETTGAGVTVFGTITDSIGPLRRLGQEIKSGDYTLVAGDAGKHIRVDGNHTITVPDNVFTSGDMITIVANSASTVAITQGSGLNLYNASDGTTGSKTMAARTVATILIAEGGSGAKAYISGGGLS